MDSGTLHVFQREFTCSICMNYFIDSITIDCGQSFCRPCFYLSWQDTSVLVHCSECKGTTLQRDFKTNICVKKLVSLSRKGSLQQFLSSEEHMCGLHKEAKQVFCEVDRSLLCMLCSSSQEHEAHRHCSIEETAEESREKLLRKMCFLWDKSCENDRNPNVETITTRSWEKIKEILKGRHFDDIQDIKGKATTALMTIPEKESQNCFEGWTRCWHWCIASQGEYFEGDHSDIQQ